MGMLQKERKQAIVLPIMVIPVQPFQNFRTSGISQLEEVSPTQLELSDQLEEDPSSEETARPVSPTPSNTSSTQSDCLKRAIQMNPDDEQNTPITINETPEEPEFDELDNFGEMFDQLVDIEDPVITEPAMDSFN